MDKRLSSQKLKGITEDACSDLTISVNQGEYFLFEFLADIIGYPLKEQMDSQKVAKSYELAVEEALEGIET
jgi:hypothetical protein